MAMFDKCRTKFYIKTMAWEKPQFEFSTDKNQQLIQQRGISFEEVIAAVESDNLLDILPHNNPTKYPNQEIYVVNINNYIWLVPFVRKDKNTVFLKTVFPHRKATKYYLRGEKNGKKKS